MSQAVFAATAAELGQRGPVGRARRRQRRRRQEGPRPHRRVPPDGDQHRRPEGPGDLRGQPVLRGRPPARDQANWVVDHEIGVPPAFRACARRDFNGRAHTARRSARSARSNPLVPRGYAVVHAESPGSGSSDGCRTPAPDRDARRDRRHRVAQRPAQGLTTPRPAPPRPRPSRGTTGNSAMMGTSCNGTLADRGRVHRRRGPEGDRPDLRPSPTGTTTTAPTAWSARRVRRPALPAARTSTCSPSTSTRATDENAGDRTICCPLIDDLEGQAGSRHGQPLRAFWDERNYMKNVKAGKLKAAVADRPRRQRLQRHDQERRAALRRACKATTSRTQFYFHQGGHGGAPPDCDAQPAGSRSTCGTRTTASRTSRSRGSCARRRPARRVRRRSPPSDQVGGGATCAVASAAPFLVGQTLTIPQTNANGSITNTTRVITNIAGNSA